MWACLGDHGYDDIGENVKNYLPIASLFEKSACRIPGHKFAANGHAMNPIRLDTMSTEVFCDDTINFYQVADGDDTETFQVLKSLQHFHCGVAARSFRPQVLPFGRQFPSPSGPPRRCYCTNTVPSDAKVIDAMESYTTYGTGPGDTNNWSEDDEVCGAKKFDSKTCCPKPGGSCGFFQYVRRLGTVSDADDCELDYTENFHKLGPGDSRGFMNRVESASTELSTELDTGLLKAEFERDYQPLLAFHCLILPCKVNEDIAAFYYGPIYGMTNLKVLYLSSLDFMLRVKTLKESERKPFVDYIIHRRVSISVDWEATYGNIELLKYDVHESNNSFVRGECDAAFQEPQHNPGLGKELGRLTKKGIAKLAFIIWKEKKVIFAEIFEGVTCSSSAFAEVLSALALLWKCEEEEFPLVEVWSDSARACGVMTGSQTIRVDDPDRDACLLLRSMQKKFTKLVVVQKPRELMFLADQLLQRNGFTGCPLKNAIQSWSKSLKGSPLFRITNNKMTSDLIRTFGKTRARMEDEEGFTFSARTTFYMKVQKEDKFDEFQKLRRFFMPRGLFLVMDGFSEKSPLLKEQLATMFPVMNTIGRITTLQDLLTLDSKKRNLVIVWDATIPRADYYRSDSCIVIFAEDDEVVEMQNRKINEINVETVLYFHRAEYKKT